MLLRKSAYFDRFRCLAGNCPDSCCKEWDVQVDRASAARYRAMPGVLGDRLRQVLRDDPEYGTVMTIENGRCPMWQTNGLCRIQAELGHDALCKTCREFPRLTHDYGDFIELGLELSCPEAARLILSAPAAPWTETQIPSTEPPEYDGEAMQILLQTRENALALLSDSRYSPPQALALLLLWSYHAQSLLDGLDVPEFLPDAVLTQARSLAVPAKPDDMLCFFSGLEILTEQWNHRLRDPNPTASWPEALRALARYGVERYWLQAVSDYDLVCRAKMVVVSCLLIRQLGGDLVATAQLYSKEIENDADNVEAILDAMYSHRAFTDSKLLGFLLSRE